MADIFISYSSEDKTIVSQIASLLEAKGWSVWWDRQIPIGQKYDTVIENELQKAGCVLVIWTQKSISSEWVKNEALEAADKNMLVPVVLEHVILPLAFRRIESALLYGWNGDKDHPELPVLYNAITTILQAGKGGIVPGNKGVAVTNNNPTTLPAGRRKIFIYSGIAIAVFIVSLLLVYHFLPVRRGANDHTITIRVSDSKKNPVPQGNVKIYLNEYIRTQSIDNMGQALFTEMPANMTRNKIKIEVSSPGYATKIFDTLAVNARPLELVLPLTTVVFISGKVKTASEMPIKGVEINVDGTKYYAVSITDGTYNLRLEEYTLGDEVTITTSHPDFEDKTISLHISSPDIKNEDIFLNPAKKR